MKNIFTVDVEDYFQVNNLSRVVPRSQWNNHQSRVEANSDKVLALLARAKVKATFFVLGWIAQRFPKIVKDIQAAGHEVASHGFSHKRICEQAPDEFRHDLRQSKKLLEAITGAPVKGYRAPTYSITRQTEWALDILIEEGFAYDSSIFPFRYQKSGLAKEKRYPHQVKRGKGSIWEFPISGLNLFGGNVPFSGGGYFRLCPYHLLLKGIKGINKRGQPAMVYVHPWEFDPGQPRFKLPALAAFRHYYNLAGTEAKLERLFSEVEFGTIADHLKAEVH
jgi:polysaccharide deacetylase family protein (PEP-CTERM system associated)